MEDKNKNYNTEPRHHKYVEPRNAKSGWIIAGVFAVAVIVGIALYNKDDNDLSNISPAAGSDVNQERNIDNR